MMESSVKEALTTLTGKDELSDEERSQLGEAEKRYTSMQVEIRATRTLVDPDREYPAFVDGARRCPPEDVSGPHGFMDFLEAVLDPAHEQHRDMVRWYGGPFDPIGFDEARAHFGMENMVRRRRGPLASHRSGSRRRKR